LQGIQRIKAEIADVDDPLIDPVHGHGRYLVDLDMSNQTSQATLKICNS